MNKADAVRVDGCTQCGTMHQVTQGVVSNQQGIEFLNDANRFVAAQGMANQTLVGVNFVNDQFDLPTLMIGANEVKCRVPFGICQGGDQAMYFSVARLCRVFERILDDTHGDMHTPVCL